MRPSLSLVALVLVVALAACGSGGGDAAPDLQGSSWRLVEVPVPGDGPRPIPAGVTIDLSFGRSEISGSSGCNTYHASSRQDGSRLKIGPIATTQIACPPDVSAIEATYLAQLDRAVSFRGGRDTLTLYDANDAAVLRFDAA